jgi:hypothetical protein
LSSALENTTTWPLAYAGVEDIPKSPLASETFHSTAPEVAL